MFAMDAEERVDLVRRLGTAGVALAEAEKAHCFRLASCFQKESRLQIPNFTLLIIIFHEVVFRRLCLKWFRSGPTGAHYERSPLVEAGLLARKASLVILHISSQSE